ncbi:response regulator transcription factor [Candidatus Curtissbacteria bacterium]|nr:response regulator transcription factor [Candidatus Curtissbacteria bacterium]
MKKVLVCEDDSGISGVIEIILTENGYEVVIVDNGRGIEKKVLGFKPDVILLDIRMPGIGGEEIIFLLKKKEETAKIPVIVVSALDNVASKAAKMGADGFLLKPFKIDVLLAKLKAVLPTSH